jgi:hypothetical protein
MGISNGAHSQAARDAFNDVAAAIEDMIAVGG